MQFPPIRALAPFGRAQAKRRSPLANCSGVPLASARVCAHGLLYASAAEIAGLRRQPGRSATGPIPASLLRHADSQTVVAVAAALRAMESSGLDASRCSEWGIVAAPRFLGRGELAAAFAQYAIDGAWGVSPHLVPHFSLHSMAGTISQALKIQGPNLGAGGGRNSDRDAFLAAMSMVASGRLPGVWLLITGWVPELVPSAAKNGGVESTASPSLCTSLALALAAPHAEGCGPRLTLFQGGGSGTVPAALFDAERLGTWLSLSGRGDRRAGWSLGDGTWIQLESASVPALQTT